uniref:Phospholipase A2 domain-containing protein n=1 Tax=Biomphalaria glabrata TaxID=6526 RepID=A0A2C9JG58_BIOGL
MTPLYFIISMLYINNVTATSKDTISKSMSDILGSLQNLVGTVKDYIGDEQGCVFQCPKGLKPYENKSHVKSSNGCGSFGFKLESHIRIKEMTKCCDEHDYCYDTCNKSKEKCDGKFKKCLADICKNIKGHLSKEAYEGCHHGVDMIYAATVALGCKPYRDAQAKACICLKRHSDL